jgi:hypothetical protein
MMPCPAESVRKSGKPRAISLALLRPTTKPQSARLRIDRKPGKTNRQAEINKPGAAQANRQANHQANHQAKAFKDSEALALLMDRAEHQPPSPHRQDLSG